MTQEIGFNQGTMIFTPVAERLAVVVLSLPVITTWICRGRDSNTDQSHTTREPPRRYGQLYVLLLYIELSLVLKICNI